MEVAVANFGPAAVKDVSVVLGEDGRARPSVEHCANSRRAGSPKERFQVNFPKGGRHTISARLESDAVAADNYRFCAIDLPADLPVLLIDGDAKARDAKFLDWLLKPGGAVRTGCGRRSKRPAI